MKKRISFLSLLVASSLIAIALASCKGANQGSASNQDFDVTTLKLWGQEIKTKAENSLLSLTGKDAPKTLEVSVKNCDDYEVEVIVGTERNPSVASVEGNAKVDLKKLPSEEDFFTVKLSANGMNTWKKKIKVVMEKTEASDLKVLFVTADDNIEKEIVKGVTPTFSTSKDTVRVIVKTTEAEMSSVKIGGNQVTLSDDKKSASYDIPVTATNGSEQDVNVEVTFDYYKNATRDFKIAKYANSSDFPLRLTSARLFSGDEGKNQTVLKFTADNKATVKIGDVRYSTVRLIMGFDSPLEGREVLKCTSGRDENYAKTIDGNTMAGLFAGYVVADLDIVKNTETPIVNIKGSAYQEILIVGAGTVSYEIKITSKAGKSQTYTIEIENTFAETPEPSSDEFWSGTPQIAGISQINWNSARSMIYGIGRFLLFPYYSKGSAFTPAGKLNPDGFNDLVYMDTVGILITQGAASPFCLYYNVMEDDGSGKPKDKHEFKRMFAGVTQGQSRRALVRRTLDLDGKYIDMFISNNKNTPYPMLPLYYGKKWRKTSVKHGFLIGLDNKVEVTWPELTKKPLPSGFAFDMIYNYRTQSIVYDNLNKATPTEPKELTIAKNQKFVWWEDGKDIPTWRPFLSGKSGEEKDVFEFFPVRTLADVSIIKEVKYTISKQEGTNYVADSTYKDYVAKDDEKDQYGTYKLGGNKDKPYEFLDGNVYKIEITAKCQVGTEAETVDKFHYIIDYKNEHTLGLMDIANAEQEDVDSNLFGVPTSFSATKALNPYVFENLTRESYAELSAM